MSERAFRSECYIYLFFLTLNSELKYLYVSPELKTIQLSTKVKLWLCGVLYWRMYAYLDRTDYIGRCLFENFT